MNRHLILASFASLFLQGLADNVRGPLYPEILQAFSLNHRVGSWMFAVTSIVAIVGAAHSRFWFARKGRMATLDMTLMLQAAAMLGYALAPNFPVLLIAAAAFGYSTGLMGVAQNSIAAHAAEGANRSRVMGGLQSMYGLSSALAPLTAAAFSGVVFGWRWSFATIGAITLLSTLALRRKERALQNGAPAVHALPPLGKQAHPLLAAWMAGLVATYVMAEILVSSRLALFQREVRGWGLEGSSLAVTGFFTGLLAGRVLTALVPLRGHPRGYLAACLSSGAVLIAVGLTVWPPALILTGLALGPVYPLYMTLLCREFEPSMDHVVGWVIAGQSLSVVVMHVGTGWLTDSFGIGKAMWLGPVALSVSLVGMLAYGPILRRYAARV